MHTFDSNGTDGFLPLASLIFDTACNLYCTTQDGGALGDGTAFDLKPQTGGGWKETVLHSFGKGKDGRASDAPLTFDTAGNLYGTTTFGGTHSNGAVFKITP